MKKFWIFLFMGSLSVAVYGAQGQTWPDETKVNVCSEECQTQASAEADYGTDIEEDETQTEPTDITVNTWPKDTKVGTWPQGIAANTWPDDGKVETWPTGLAANTWPDETEVGTWPKGSPQQNGYPAPTEEEKLEEQKLQADFAKRESKRKIQEELEKLQLKMPS